MKTGKTAFVFSTIFFILTLFTVATPILAFFYVLNFDWGGSWSGILFLAMVFVLAEDFAPIALLFGVLSIVFSIFSIKRSWGARKVISKIWLSLTIPLTVVVAGVSIWHAIETFKYILFY